MITWFLADETLSTRQPIQKCPGIECRSSPRCVSKKRRCDRIIDCLEADDEMACPTDNSFPSLIKHAIDNMLLFSTHNITEMDEHETIKKSSDRVKTEVTVSRHERNFTDFPDDDSPSNTTFQSIRQDLDTSRLRNVSDLKPESTTTQKQVIIINETSTAKPTHNVNPKSLSTIIFDNHTNIIQTNPDVFLCKM